MIFNPLSLFNHYHNNCSSFFNVKTKKKIFFIFISNKIIPMLTHTSHTLFVISHRSAQQIHIVSFIFLDMNESKNARIPAGNQRITAMRKRGIGSHVVTSAQLNNMKLTLDIAQWNADITETQHRRETGVVISWYNTKLYVMHQDASMDSSLFNFSPSRYHSLSIRIIVHVIREAAFVMILA